MTRLLRYLVPLMLLIGGCQPLPKLGLEDALAPADSRPVIVYTPAALTSEWLLILDQQLKLTPEQASEGIRTSEPPVNDTQRFKQLLFRQQLQQRGGWVVARDRLRELLENYRGHEVEPLLSMLLAHNQALINRDQREQRLNQQLSDLIEAYETVIRRYDESIAETEQLNAKIEALTNLERQLNIRRSKDATNGPAATASQPVASPSQPPKELPTRKDAP
ncbi:hypothetical protein DV711_01775 [Motiliproteus coralliicola]|uniref:Uncharacterized protein n=1 Tax=Motiliproteus coralliicola TaxID=2283196 RepID=A0A369WXX1_9GAMM|nr:hypothetical protein [Motiliproteus coralliicola]RDE24345.1 hypothetical protein DV711_01775 [Motiliproteus coralliicola]